jgi:hypothetical protein
VDADIRVGDGAGVHLGVGLLADGGDDDGEAVGAGGVEQQEREAPVAGDEAEFADRGTPSSPPGGCTASIVESAIYFFTLSAKIR